MRKYIFGKNKFKKRKSAKPKYPKLINAYVSLITSDHHLSAKEFLDVCEPHNGGWRTTARLKIHVRYENKSACKNIFEKDIPKGTVWDGASIPKIFRWLVGDPTDKEFALSSFVHDLLYRMRFIRSVADQVFYFFLQGTRFKDIPTWKENLMYVGVRIGGQAFYASKSNIFWRVVRSVA
jgi:Protein of unknown function (DUF1353).